MSTEATTIPTPTDCDVLVIGAGPTGLMAATLLQRQGIRARIVEKRAEASRESRAFAIQARTLELFLSIGLADALFDRGVVNTGVEFYVGGRHTGGLDFDAIDAPDTPYPFVFLLPQSETEAILIDDLSQQGVEVERDVEVTGLEQDADGVVTRATDANGQEITIRSAYVIGADGAHSAVRKAIGLAFEGAQYAQTFLLADCRVNWPLDHNRFRIFIHGDLIGLFLPLHGLSRSRVMATDRSNRANEDGPTTEPLDLAELQSAFAEVTGMDVSLDEAAWATRYRIHHRSVDRYGLGRVFVAGDAAHIHSPAGGQGMNTGLQDAANLAWKLAAVIRRGASPALLETYDSERRPVGEQVVANSDRLFTIAAGQTGWEATVRDWIAAPVSAAISHLSSVQRKAFRTVAELEIAYEPSLCVEDAATQLSGGPPAGHRAPNAVISRFCDVFDLIAGDCFTVLALSRQPLENHVAEPLAAELDAIAALGEGDVERGGGSIQTRLVSRMAFGRDPRVIFVERPDVFTAYGLTRDDSQALYLIRPDGYVAWRSDGLNLAACRDFLTRLGFSID